MVRFNPTNKNYKSITGALPEDKPFVLSVEIDKNVKANRVFLRFHKDGQEDILRRHMPLVSSDATYDRYSIEINFAFKGLYFYYFEIETGWGNKYVCPSESLDGVWCDEVYAQYQLTVFRPQKNNADWFKGGVVYHVFVDRFAKNGELEYPVGAVLNENWGQVPDHLPVNGKILNNEFFGGNIKGICDKLGYIKSLGVTTIYLSPVFKANSNHKYNTGDFLQIDPGFGDEQIFAEFVSKADEMGIKIILDGVFNHTGDDSIYFNRYGRYDSVGAYQSKQSPYYDWFNFDVWPREYASWWGIQTLPATNKSNPAYIDFICERVVPKWLKMGVAGFRLDVVDELPDVFLDPLCKAIKDCGDKVIIGEVWENATDKISYNQRRRYFQGGQLDSVMNYPLKDAIIKYLVYGDGHYLKNVVLQQLNNYPKDNLDKLFNLLSSHDTKRIVTALSNIEIASKDSQATFKLSGDMKEICKCKQLLAAVLQYTLYGVPCLFYGDEAGLEGFGDPFCRQCYPWGKEDRELIEFYRNLGNLRHDEVFVDSEIENVNCYSGLFSFERKKEGKGYKIFVNADKYPHPVLNGENDVVCMGKLDDNGCVPPFGYVIFKTK